MPPKAMNARYCAANVMREIGDEEEWRSQGGVVG